VTDKFPPGKTPWHRMSARTLAQFERAGADLGWWDDYQALKAQGHGWKIAAYIAWASSPYVDRDPPTIKALCEQCLGVTARTLRKWREQDETIDETVSLLQAAPLLAHRRDIYDALIKVATDPDPKAHADRKLALEMLDDYKPRAGIDHGGSIRTGTLTADQYAQAEFELEEFLEEQGVGDDLSE
jgi:hypothetical protein